MQRHEWRLKFRRVLCPRTVKHLPLRKTKEEKVAKNREKDSNILFNKLQVFDICCVAYCNDQAMFAGFCLISLESLDFL